MYQSNFRLKSIKVFEKIRFNHKTAIDIKKLFKNVFERSIKSYLKFIKCN